MRAFRASLLHFLADPGDGFGSKAARSSYRYEEDGLLVTQDGLVLEAGPAAPLLKRLPRGVAVKAFPGSLIVPGFVDCHVHFPQAEMIASYGERLLEWLKRYAFPAELKYARAAYARRGARFFLGELLRNGTTTASVFPTVHPASVEALFSEAERLNLRLVSGKVLMDRNAPRGLRDTPERSLNESRALIEKWHGRGRLLYAVTPRFAATSSERQLKAAGRLLREHPTVRLQTHLSENREELSWIRKLFPWSRSYLEVYDRFGLVGPRSLFAQSIHLSDAELRRLASVGAAVAFCPSSNLFLGSGLFSLKRTAARGVAVGLGSDVGAGTSFSLLENMEDAYKVAQLRGERLTPLKAFYLATLGGARALGLDGRIGSFLPGKEADFAVLDPAATPLLADRLARARSLEERLFALINLGDDRCVAATYVLGERAHVRKAL